MNQPCENSIMSATGALSPSSGIDVMSDMFAHCYIHILEPSISVQVGCPLFLTPTWC
jgi:hypothetical protein